MISESGNFLKLEEGVTYNYNLEGNTETYVPKSKGPFGESVKLNFKAKVEVSSLPECKTVVQLRNVQVTGPDGKVGGGGKDFYYYVFFFENFILIFLIYIFTSIALSKPSKIRTTSVGGESSRWET